MDMSAQAEQVKTGISTLFLLLLIPVAIALFFIIRFIYRNTIGEKMKTTLLEDYKKEAEGFEKVRQIRICREYIRKQTQGPQKGRSAL